MSYQVFWIIENQVLYDNQSGDVTVDEIRALSAEIADMLEDAYQQNRGFVVAILDMREANVTKLLQTHTPAGIRHVTDALDPRIWKMKKGFTILITNRAHVKIIISLITMLVSQPITTVASFDEAIEITANMYPELRETLQTWKGADPLAQQNQ